MFRGRSWHNLADVMCKPKPKSKVDMDRANSTRQTAEGVNHLLQFSFFETVLKDSCLYQTIEVFTGKSCWESTIVERK